MAHKDTHGVHVHDVLASRPASIAMSYEGSVECQKLLWIWNARTQGYGGHQWNASLLI